MISQLYVVITICPAYICSYHYIVTRQNMVGAMKKDESFEGRLASRLDRLGPTELRVAQFLRDNREEVLVSSASTLALRTSTSEP